MENKRAVGVTIIARLYQYLAIILVLMMGSVVLFAPVDNANLKLKDTIPFMALFVLISISLLIISLGLLKLKKWAYYISVFGSAIFGIWYLLPVIGTLKNGKVIGAIFYIFVVIGFGATFYYLTRPKVKEQFK
jgi:hypothetical protein